MMESNNSEINVDELMVKIREEVARRRAQHSPPPSFSQLEGPILPTIDWPRVNASLQAAEYQAQHVGTAVPEWTRFGRVKRKIAQRVARLVLYLSDFIINQQKQLNGAILNTLRTLGDNLRTLENRFGEQVRQKDTTDQALDAFREAIGRIEHEQQATLQRLDADLVQREARLQAVTRQVSQAHDTLQRLDADLVQREARLQAITQRVSETHTALQRLEQEQQAVLQRLDADLVQREAQTQEVLQEMSKVHTALQQLEHAQQAGMEQMRVVLGQRQEQERTLEKTLYQLKINLLQQERRLTLLLEEARKRLPAPLDQTQLQMLANEDQHRLDALYVSFEDQFRGTREDIKERLRVYLPLLKEQKIGTEQLSILDVGCGRGEWLELLREEGLIARGIDRNRVLVAQCQQLGFSVTESDLIAYLRHCTDSSIGAITGFHIIEHLSLDELITLLDETVRVLVPGGIAIFETPNPQNLIVGSCNFYLDPTHRNPLPSPTMRFLAEARGLCQVEVLYLHPYPAAFRVDGLGLAERFNEFFYGPQDYAIVGRKV